MQISKFKIAILIFILIGVVTISCDDSDDALYKDPTMPIEDRINDLLPRMTLDDKIGQMGPGPLIKYPRTLLEYALSLGTSNTPDNHRLDIPGLKMSVPLPR